MSNTTQNDYQGDLLENLPVDKSSVDTKELEIIQTLFGDHQKNNFKNNITEVLLFFIFFIFFNLPQINFILKKILPPLLSSSFYYLLFIKAFFVCIIFYIIKRYVISK
jgi:hypothetical protein